MSLEELRKCEAYERMKRLGELLNVKSEEEQDKLLSYVSREKLEELADEAKANQVPALERIIRRYLEKNALKRCEECLKEGLFDEAKNLLEKYKLGEEIRKKINEKEYEWCMERGMYFKAADVARKGNLGEDKLLLAEALL